MNTFFSELLFWGLFLVFNFTLFAFNYFIQIDSNNFLPFSLKGLKKGRRGVFISYNMDFFRFSMEISIIILLYRFAVLEKGIYIFSFIYCFLLIFNIYHFAFAYIYKTTPVIANDIKLLRDGMAILYNESKIKLLGYAIGLIILVIAVFTFFTLYLSFSLRFEPVPITYFVTLLLSVVFVSAILRKGIYRNRRDLTYRFLFMTARLIAHIRNSHDLLKNKLRFKNLIKSIEEKDVITRAINKKPNLYFIFIESYGSLLVKENKIKSQYKSLIEDFTQQLNKSNWGVKSNLSESITLIGPSWLAYSSFLYGCRIESHLTYEYLIKNKAFHKIDSILNTLNENNYTIFNLNPTKPNANLPISMDDLTSFYHVDNWILRDDINYKGLEYGFGEFPADQYTLNYAYENYLRQFMSPFILFYLTKNSHSPYISPKKPLDDWRKINGCKKKDHSISGGFLTRPNLTDYINSIQYQIKVIEKFIIENGNENDIFLLVGDHQPHELTNGEEFGLETIVHVVSKNQNFLNGFEKYGFRDSLYDNISPVKHEGLHSAFLRELLRCFGKSENVLPDYEPNGKQLP